jgi:4-carboxymuconolactone decarboxylase
MNYCRIVCGAVFATALSAGALYPSRDVVRAQSADAAADIHPATGNRLPPVQRDRLDEAQKRVYDELIKLHGPVNALRGAAAMRLHGSESAGRTGGATDARLIELAIINTAREENQQFEWYLHEIRARAAGVPYDVIDVIRFKKPLTGVAEPEASLIQLARDVFRTNRVTSAAYARALKAHGQTTLVDVASTMAHYCASAVALNAFDQQLPLMPLEPGEAPSDIHSDSRNRLPMLKDDATRKGGIAPPGTGPASIRRHGSGSRTLAEAALGPRLRALAALVTARQLNGPYDWTINEVRGLKDGLEPSVIDTVRRRKALTGLPEKEASLIALGREVFSEQRRVGSATYARALKAFGEKTLVDAVVVMGEHCDDHIMLTIFDQRLPPGQPSLLPAE